jgi:hypothetical protein
MFSRSLFRVASKSMFHRLLDGALSVIFLTCLVSNSVKADPGDFVKVTSGGTMSEHSEISIDLDSGRITAWNWGLPWQRNGQPAYVGSQLAPEALESLKAIVRASLTEGLESKVCIDEARRYEEAMRSRAGEAPPPPRQQSPDALGSSLEARLERKYGIIADITCWSSGANKLSAAASRYGSPPPQAQNK